MRVFIAGASGVIGRELTRQLIERGHQVSGMTRSSSGAETVRAAGGEPVLADVLDAAATRDAVAAARPDVVVQQLTQLPKDKFNPRTIDYTGTAKVRVEGTKNLLAAMDAAGCNRLIGQSISFLTAPTGARVLDEDAPVLENVQGRFGIGLSSTLEMERLTLDAGGTVLRYGFLYGPDTWYAKNGYFGKEARKRRLPVVGKGAGVFSFVHVADAAGATVAAIESPKPGLYNVTDDEPAAMRDWVPAFCAGVGAKKPMRVPVWLARLVAGKFVAAQASESRGASNARAHAAFPDWTLRYPTYREGFANGL